MRGVRARGELAGEGTADGLGKAPSEKMFGLSVVAQVGGGEGEVEGRGVRVWARQGIW